MEGSTLTDHNDSAAIFFKHWATYRRVVDADYMSHRALFGLLHDLLVARTRPFSFLDLASGDAACSVGALTGTAVSDYTAVDLSEQALEVAAKNVRSLGCEARTVSRDFRDFFDPPPRTWDVIFIGFSFHHLAGDDKLSFARKLRSALNPGGEWIFFEPILSGGESRAGYLERWKSYFEQHWTICTPEEKVAIWEHVSECDHPESPEQFDASALHAGFTACEHLFTDPCGFYGGFRAIA
jgi:cyclopropane fatty-acyl-phospholipid synthase-like methyltransferase